MAHIDAGKTTTTERLLFYAGKTYKLGEVDDGTTVTDWMKEEQRRGITIVAAAIGFTWRDCLITLIDTPGHVDFTAEVERSLRVLDGGVAVLCGVGGVEAQTETVWRQADRYKVPRICFVNKLDRLGADFYRTVEAVEKRLGATPLVLQLPIGREKEFRGAVDLVARKAVHFDRSERNAPLHIAEIPPDLLEQSNLWHDRLVERVAENCGRLTDKYLETGSLSEQDLREGIREITVANKGVPVLCGSALKKMGIRPLLDAVCDYLPSPLDIPPVQGTDAKDESVVIKRKPLADEKLTALAFKVESGRYDDLVYVRVYTGTLRSGKRLYNPRRDRKEAVTRIFSMMANRRERQLDVAGPGEIVGVCGLRHTFTGDTLCETDDSILLEPMQFPSTVISMAIEPRTQADREKLNESLGKLAREDPTFEAKNDPETGQLVVSGMGELHLEVIKNRLLENYGVDANVGAPRVAYKETVAAAVEAEGRIEQQAGTRGAFAVVRMHIEPADLRGNVRFVNAFENADFKKRYIEAIRTGVLNTVRGGVVTGYPLINARITLTGAQDHPVDSDDNAFEAAASIAVRRGMETAGAVLLEPVMSLEVTAPGQYLGDIISDLNSRRACINHIKDRADLRVIEAEAPLSEMFGYATALRSLTQGRGNYTLEPSGYQPAPQKAYDQWVV